MNSAKAVTALFVAILLTAGNVSASCPTITYRACCGTYWYEFAVDSSCYSTSGSVSTGTLSCSLSGPAFGTGSSTASWTFTIPSNYSPITYWGARFWLDFNSPNQSINDGFSSMVTVTHNGVNSYYYGASFGGASSSTQSCTVQDIAFNAVPGDDVTVTYLAAKANSNATINPSDPVVQNHW